jgi:hypothetical protein
VTAAAVVRRRVRPTTVQLAAAATVALVGVAAWALAWAMEHATYDTVAGAFVGITLGFASLAAGRVLARREPDVVVARLLLIAPILKLAMAVARFAVAFVLYDGSADAAVYHDNGVRLSGFFDEGVFAVELGKPFVGGGSIRALTGLLYVVTGPTMLGAFFVFSWIGFWGLYLFYRAFRLAVPDGDHRRYAFMVLLLPSLLFWPSSLGKEAIMTLALGLVAYGSARLLVHRPHGLLIVGLGLVTMGAVRPHVGAMAAVGLTAAFVSRRTPKGAALTAPLTKLVGLILLGLVLVVAVTQTKALLGIDEFNTEALEAARAEVSTRTDEAGSTFTPVATDFEPLRFHVALASVLFRPFPWEAGSAQGTIASLEGLTLLVLFVVGWRRLLGAVRTILRAPYVVMCITYTVLFTYGFSSFANFGILTRQRVQVLPFALVLLALPPYRGRIRDARALLGVPSPEPEQAREPALGRVPRTAATQREISPGFSR